MADPPPLDIDWRRLYLFGPDTMPGAERMVGYDGTQTCYVVIRDDDRVIVREFNRTGAEEVVTNWHLPKARVVKREAMKPTVRRARPSDGAPPIGGFGSSVSEDGKYSYQGVMNEDGTYTETGTDNIDCFMVEYGSTTKPSLQAGEKEENLILLITPKQNATHEGIAALKELYPGKDLLGGTEYEIPAGGSLCMLNPWMYPNYRQDFIPARSLQIWCSRPYRGGKFDIPDGGGAGSTAPGEYPEWAKDFTQPTPYQYYHIGFHRLYGDYMPDRRFPLVYSEAIHVKIGSLAVWSSLPIDYQPDRPTIRQIRQDPISPVILEFPYLSGAKPIPSGLGPPDSRSLTGYWIFSPAAPQTPSVRFDDASEVGVTPTTVPFLPRHPPEIFHDALEWVAIWLYIEQEEAEVEVEVEPTVPPKIGGLTLGGSTLGIVRH